jgi:hypothetical protein
MNVNKLATIALLFAAVMSAVRLFQTGNVEYNNSIGIDIIIILLINRD